MKNIIIAPMLFLLPVVDCMGQTLQVVTNNGNTTTNSIGIGGASTTNAILNVNGSIGGTNTILGGDNRGISIYSIDPTIGFNAYYNGSTWNSIGNGFSSIIQLYHGNGILSFYTSPSMANSSSQILSLANNFNLYPSGSVWSSGQGRFTGWYNSGESVGPAAEIGVSSGIANVLGYDRTAAYYIPLSLTGGTSNGTNSLWLDDNGAAFKANGSITTALISSSGQIYADFNNTTIDYAHAALRLDNPNASGQTTIYFTNGSSQHGSIRVDAGGNFLMNANSGNYYYSNDFGSNVNLIAGNTRFLFANSSDGFVGLGGITNPENVLTLPNSQYIAWKTASGAGEAAGITVGTDDAIHIYNNRMGIVVGTNGYVGIGTTNPQSLLSVKGAITTQQVTVTQTGWADFVFDKGYRLKPLSEVEEYIHTYKHLPDIQSEKEIESKGLNLGDMEQKQMEKIEELTRYLLEEHKTVKRQQQKIDAEQQEIDALKEQIILLKNKIK